MTKIKYLIIIVSTILVISSSCEMLNQKQKINAEKIKISDELNQFDKPAIIMSLTCLEFRFE